MTLLSPLGSAVAELAADTAVKAIVGLDANGARRVRPIEPGPGDALGAGQYIAFVVVSILDSAPMGHMGVRETTLGIKAYAATFAAAEALWLVCEAVFRDRGARIATSRLGVYPSQVTAGGIPDKDPDPLQPLFHGIVNYPTAIAAVPA